MKNIVILGAGTGGTVIANLLSSKLNLKEWAITIIDKSDEHHYQPGYLFLPLRLYGYEERDKVVRRIDEKLPRNTSFVKAEIKLIDHVNKKVETGDGVYAYDFLITAMGCRIAPEEVEGMAEAMGNDVHTFYSLDGAMQLQQAMDGMESGRLLVHIADMPIKCPVAPIEYAFLSDYYFNLKGIRDQVDITLVTPFSGAFTKPNANRILSGIAEEKRVSIAPNFSIERVDQGRKQIHSFEGETLDYDLLVTIPPNVGPAVIDASGLGDGTGYVLTDPRTLQARKADGVYVLGDNSNVATSKAGSVAHFEAETVLENILNEIEGKKPIPSFDGHANCYIESGYNKALLLDFNYDVEPLEGHFPRPMVGPFSLLKESYINHMGKIVFDWVYWNMLLTGILPMVPLIPSQMNFIGKDLTTLPKVQRSKEIKIRDVMTTDVVTVQTGAPVYKAAEAMVEHNISSVPIVDVDNKLIGILSESDFLSALNISEDGAVAQLFDMVIRRNRPKRAAGTTVDGMMTPNPITVGEDASLRQAIELMDHNSIKRLVITNEEDHVKGVISRPDLMKLFSRKG
ncbi:MAG: CBS domain-containing protein [Pseudomonadota bacterium]|nr:CBS domain-containing protein [Pseudomonadota bacterium]